jgi:hypothetical protein
MPVLTRPPASSVGSKPGRMIKNGRGGGQPTKKNSAKGPRKLPGERSNYRTDWRPPTPQSDPPLAPAPLFSPLKLLALGVLTLGQWLWGLLNSRQPRAQLDTIPSQTINFDAPSTISFTWLRTQTQGITYWCPAPNSGVANWPSEASYGDTETAGGVTGIQFMTDPIDTSYPCNSTPRPGGNLGWTITRPDGNQSGSAQIGMGTVDGPSFLTMPQGSITLKITNFRVNGVLQPPPLAPLDPLYVPPPMPALRPLGEEAAPQPVAPTDPLAPVVAPPVVVPLIPFLPFSPADPAPAGSPSPAGVPLPAPLPSPTPQPVTGSLPQPGIAQSPTPQPGPDGSLVPVPPPAVVPTLPGVEQTPDGPVGGPGTSPPPTLQGIAQEVGRIEQKVLRLLNRPNPQGDLTDMLQLLLQLLDLLGNVHQGGEYLLSGPCDFDETGEPMPPREAGWPGGFGQLALLSKKIDALAQLIQHHKELRQPTCKRGPVGGQPVTVLFEEV